MRRNLVWLASTAAALTLLYWAGLNRNLFYLMFAYGCAAVLIVLANRTLARASVVVILLISSVLTIAKPLPTRVSIQERAGSNSRKMDVGETLLFRFALTDLEARRAECGQLDPFAIVAGVNLVAMDIRVNGAHPAIRHLKQFDTDVAWVDLPTDVKDTVDVTITAGENVSLYRGPEVHGRAEYLDAVFLLFRNPDEGKFQQGRIRESKCRVLYHARAVPLGKQSSTANDR